MEETFNAISTNPIEAITDAATISKTLNETLRFLFRLAWSLRIKFPAALTFLFLACDVRLSIEIRVEAEDVDLIDDEQDNNED